MIYSAAFHLFLGLEIKHIKKDISQVADTRSCFFKTSHAGPRLPPPRQEFGFEICLMVLCLEAVGSRKQHRYHLLSSAALPQRLSFKVRDDQDLAVFVPPVKRYRSSVVGRLGLGQRVRSTVCSDAPTASCLSLSDLCIASAGGTWPLLVGRSLVSSPQPTLYDCCGLIHK
ncbi:hypothetical protein ARMGADRAFT_129686 [Armillaria gallica]|uniref:Uncharacterized protein n=1 Tax=Armillaria gallica TaxID=47427 RepID=A0A2H3E1M0_ARMGA|nr:hypothetical protein ARMGADRAFT_129686 [Armillaria gallica]